jgi:eukaryotic-like serine/threonine-protein kinase
VHHAHQRGILHRDLKPGNIILDDRGEPHVTDFGLAKRVQADSTLTQSGAIVGTPAYMAPEQASGKRGMVTTATDVYGLGAILYALLTGRAPFKGESPVETLERVRELTPQSPSKLNPRIPRDLDVIAMKCLDKDPARRYGSALALAEDLGRFLNGESILARPVWAMTRAWMWCKRKPAEAGVLMAILIAIGCAMGVVLIEKDRRREIEARKQAEIDFEMAQTATEDYLSSISGNTLLKEQDSVDIRGFRRELLENTLRYYKRFVSLRSNELFLRRRVATAYFRIGQITSDIGSAQDAIAAYHTAADIWLSEVAATPHDDQLKSHLADCHLAIGIRKGALGDLHGAMDALNQARLVLEDIVGRNPMGASVQSRLVNCYAEISNVQDSTGAADHGLGLLEKAERIQRQLIAQAPGDWASRQILAEMINSLGFVHFKRHDLRGALRCFRQVQQACMSLLDEIGDRPKPVKILSLLANSHFNIATILVGQDKKEALKELEKSVEYRRALADSHPSVSAFRENLASSYREVAIEEQRAGQKKIAMENLHKAVDVFEKLIRSEPEQARYHAGLGRTLNAIGWIHDEIRENRLAISEFEQAVKEQQDAIARSPHDNEYKLYLCNHLENLGEQYLDLGSVSDAWPYYIRAIEIRRKLNGDHQENVDYAQTLAEALCRLGSIKRHAGDPAAALKWFAEEREVAEQFLKSKPDNAVMRCRLAEAFTQETWVQLDLKQTDIAMQSLQEAVDALGPLANSPTGQSERRGYLTEALQARALILRTTRQVAAADKVDAERLALWEGEPAGGLANLALAQVGRAARIGYGKTQGVGTGSQARDIYLDLAAANLKLALARGFVDLAMLRSNPECPIILERDDIKPLLMDLAFPAWPFAQHQ